MSQLDQFNPFQDIEEQSRPNVCSSNLVDNNNQNQQQNFPILSNSINNNRVGNMKQLQLTNLSQQPSDLFNLKISNKQSSFSLMLLNNNSNNNNLMSLEFLNNINNNNENNQNFNNDLAEDQHLDDLFLQQSEKFAPQIFDNTQNQQLFNTSMKFTQQPTQKQQPAATLQLKSYQNSQFIKQEAEQEKQQKIKQDMINEDNNQESDSVGLPLQEESTNDEEFQFEFPNFEEMTQEEEQQQTQTQPQQQQQQIMNPFQDQQNIKKEEIFLRKEVQDDKEKEQEKNEKKIWNVTHKIQKQKKKQRDYDKNICRYLARQVVRCFVDRTYKPEVWQFCAEFLEKNTKGTDNFTSTEQESGNSSQYQQINFGQNTNRKNVQENENIASLYQASTGYLLSQIEFISGQRAFQELLVLKEENEKYANEKMVFRKFTYWFLKERAFRYIITGAMSDKKSYLKFKNDILLYYIKKPETWTANISRKDKKRQMK